MRISFSQIDQYKRCPRQYEFANVKKLSRPMSSGESFGSSVHNALAKWGKLEIGLGQGQGNDDQLELFSDEEEANLPICEFANLLEVWHQSFFVEGYESRAEADMARKRGEELMKFFYSWWEKEERRVVGVEKGFVLGDRELGVGDRELQISGRFDRVEEIDGGLRVIDFKTGRVRTQEEADADLQLSIYALACQEVWGKPAVELILLFLSEEGTEERVTYRNESQLRDAKKQIELSESRIVNGDFAPNPSVAVCRCCPYKGVCDVSAI